MSRRRTIARIGAAAAACSALLVGLGAGAASAHPLRNFSVNHAHALTVTRSGVVDDAVIDAAEIPTAQAEPLVDIDDDGDISADEADRYAVEQCETLARSVDLVVDGRGVPFSVTSSSYVRSTGAAGLMTSRLECRLEAAADLATASATDRDVAVSFTDRLDDGRVGWREIVAVGDGVHVVDSTVPESSSTQSLRAYPDDLLSSPLDVRTATFTVSPTPPASSTAAAPSTSTEVGGSLGDAGPLGDLVARVDRWVDDLIGRRDLTLGVGLLAVSLAVLLGASHALLPGHGKTLMAAYIAGRQGTSRDAVIVGATVTATHTGGVLLLGTALSVSTTLAGERVVAWLGVASGALVAALGVSLLVGAVRRRGNGHGHHHGHHGHVHHGHDHHDHGHGHGHHEHHAHDHHDHDHDHDHNDHDHHDHDHDHHDHDHDHHDHDHDHHAHSEPAPVSRRGLVAMGVAGGLVPSPSALIVLLSAIALGRTLFGVLLVIGYGLGMAATLTAAGLLLVRVRDRLRGRTPGRAARRLGSAARRWRMLSPALMAGLVLVVGTSMAMRGLGQLR